jgi:SAM-dependent methyltransferase
MDAPPARRLPYPVDVQRRAPHREPPLPASGVETFDTDSARAINLARMGHLESLGLNLDGKTVLDVGSGVGHLAQFFVGRGCRVVSVDARTTNIESLRSRYPGLEARVLDVESEPLGTLGQFEVVFCYGLLYHLEDPLAALRNIASVCDGTLLLETIVCDHSEPVLVLVDESVVSNQALSGLGCRPSPAYVTMALNRAGFPHVYAPRDPPDHPEFRFEWRNDLAHVREGRNLRCVFVASRRELCTDTLTPLLSVDAGELGT